MAETNNNTSKALKGMSSQTVVTIMLGLVEIISFSIMSRLLTPKDFGYFAALSAILVIFNSFAETGIGSAIIQRKDVSQKFINNAFTLCLMFGSIVSAALFFLSDFLARLVVDETMATPLKLMSLTILCSCMTSPYISILYRRLKFMTVGYINLAALVITTIVAVILAAKGFGYYAIIVKSVSTSILCLIFAAIISKTKFSIEWDSSMIKSIWKYSGWLMASVVFRNFAQQCDRLLMSRLLSVNALGAYNRPKDFINTISIKLNGIFDTALFPVLSGIQDNIPSLQRAFEKSLYMLNLFAIMLTMAFFFNAELIIRLFFGEQWLNLVGLFQVLALALIFNVDGRLADCFLRSLALTKSQFYFRIVETIIKFSGVIIGAIYFGLYGVAIAVVFSNSIMVLVKVCYIAKHIELKSSTPFYTIIRAWQPMVIFLPIMTVLMVLLPHSLINCVILLGVFVMLSCVLFLASPNLVGREYKNGVYLKIHEYIKNKINKR